MYYSASKMESVSFQILCLLSFYLSYLTERRETQLCSLT